MADSAPASERPAKRPVLKIQTPNMQPASTVRRKNIFQRLRLLFSRLLKRRTHASKPRRHRHSLPMRKPMIYVFSPTDIDVSVAVTLPQNMGFTAVYPVVPIQKLQPEGEKIQWDVHTGVNGNLIVKETGLEMSSLFWEADLSPQNQNSASPNHRQDMDRNPMKWDITDSNSVLLRADEVTGYLEKALMSLGLHTEARTAFITFWLPFLLKHRHIALRFIPQSEYSQIAPLEITPKPDVVTRVFMLFKGVDDVDSWASARQLACEDVSRWAEVVGVDITSTLDKNLSRVLEWGAMELPS